MGFCRRCGDIVSGTRCKCGGTAVAPVVPWNQSGVKDTPNDKWSNTYVHRARSLSPTRPVAPQLADSTNTTLPASPSRHFPRPISRTGCTFNLDHRISAHIASSISSQNHSSSPSFNVPVPENDILPSIHDATLSKVYGSVLQPQESLNTHSCALCSSPFPPDTTIYPDPGAPSSSRFLCRTCYEENGGTKGICPSCTRPVLSLKSEGPYIHAANQFWHKKCFNCCGCFKHIGDNPMVDLLGRPSCADCFESCLKRDPSTPKKFSPASTKNSPQPVRRSSNIGGMSSTSKTAGRPTRESSPAIEELEQRLGITAKREGSPITDDLSRKLVNAGLTSSTSGSPVTRRRATSTISFSTLPSTSGSPVREHGYPSVIPRSPKESTPVVLSSPSSPSRARMSVSKSEPSLPSGIHFASPQTPDLVSDVSETATQSSFSLESPPRNGREDMQKVDDADSTLTIPHRDFFETSEDIIAEENDSQMGTGVNASPQLFNTPMSRGSPVPSRSFPETNRPNNRAPSDFSARSCAGCRCSLLSNQGGGKFVSIPNNGTDQYYHVECFRCNVCDGTFNRGLDGQAVFVKANGGPCHVECAPPAKVKVHKIPPTRHSLLLLDQTASSPPVKHTSARTNLVPSTSSRLEKSPFAPSTSSSMTSSLRFGSRTICPGCSKAVSPMEPGVVPGPQNTRWHGPCLVCGGKKERPKGMIIRRGTDEKKINPGCGKRLDSAARTASDGGVWCRECLLLLGAAGSPQASPTRSPLVPTTASTASTSKLTSQVTGTTTIARQFTGIGSGSDPGLLRQLTGGGLSPTRSISPTKQLSMGRPRPKSVIGMRSTKSVDEGRGMFLVRQMTGTSVANT